MLECESRRREDEVDHDTSSGVGEAMQQKEQNNNPKILLSLQVTRNSV